MNAVDRWTKFFTSDERIIEANSQVTGLRKIINDRTGRYSLRERENLLSLVNAVCAVPNKISPVLISVDLADRGFDWLSAMHKRLASQKNRTNDEDQFVRRVPNVLANGPCEFRFRGLWDASSHMDTRFNLIPTMPMWQVIDKDKSEAFSYAYSSWQSRQGLIFISDFI